MIAPEWNKTIDQTHPTLLELLHLQATIFSYFSAVLRPQRCAVNLTSDMWSMDRSIKLFIQKKYQIWLLEMYNSILDI